MFFLQCFIANPITSHGDRWDRWPHHLRRGHSSIDSFSVCKTQVALEEVWQTYCFFQIMIEQTNYKQHISKQTPNHSKSKACTTARPLVHRSASRAGNLLFIMSFKATKQMCKSVRIPFIPDIERCSIPVFWKTGLEFTQLPTVVKTAQYFGACSGRSHFGSKDTPRRKTKPSAWRTNMNASFRSLSMQKFQVPQNGPRQNLKGFGAI